MVTGAVKWTAGSAGNIRKSLRKGLVLTLFAALFSAGNLATAVAEEPELVSCSNSGLVRIQGSILISNESCTGTVDIPFYVISISDFSFSGAAGLTGITFAQNSMLETIGIGAFKSTSLKEIKIPAGVTSIGDEAFANTADLTKVTFELNSQLDTIGIGAFKSSGLKEITIPSSVRIIGDQAFLANSDLVVVSFENGSLLETIGSEAFRSTGLKKITIPTNVTSIGNQVFADSTDLALVAFLGDAPNVGSDVFRGISDAGFASVITGATGFEPDLWSAIRIKYSTAINCSTSGYVLVVDWAIRDDVACEGDLEIPSTVFAISEGAFYGSKLRCRQDHEHPNEQNLHRTMNNLSRTSAS
jgi:hypothetical protein